MADKPEAVRGMPNGRDGFCKPVAYVLYVTKRPPRHKTLRTGLQIPSGDSMGMTERQAPAWPHAESAKLELGVP